MAEEYHEDMKRPRPPPKKKHNYPLNLFLLAQTKSITTVTHVELPFSCRSLNIVGELLWRVGVDLSRYWASESPRCLRPLRAEITQRDSLYKRQFIQETVHQNEESQVVFPRNAKMINLFCCTFQTYRRLAWSYTLLVTTRLYKPVLDMHIYANNTMTLDFLW